MSMSINIDFPLLNQVRLFIFSPTEEGEIPSPGRYAPGWTEGILSRLTQACFPTLFSPEQNGNHPISLRKKLRQIRQHYGQRGKTKKDLVHKHFLCTSAAFTPALLTVHPPGGRSEEKDAWTEGMDNFHKSLLLLAYIQEKVYCLKTGGVISPSFTVTALLECATFKSWLMDVSLARWSQLK